MDLHVVDDHVKDALDLSGVVRRGETLGKALDRAAQDDRPDLIDRYGDQLRTLDARILAQRGPYVFVDSRIAEQGCRPVDLGVGECNGSVGGTRVSGHHQLCVIEGQSRKACDDGSPDVR